MVMYTFLYSTLYSYFALDIWDFWQREKFYLTRLLCMLWNAWFREVYWEENLRGASSLSAASNLLADAAAAVAPQ